MADPINLNKARKARAKADKQQRAAQSRAKFGRTKANKAKVELETSRAPRAVDAAKLDKKS